MLKENKPLNSESRHLVCFLTEKTEYFIYKHKHFFTSCAVKQDVKDDFSIRLLDVFL